MKKLHYVIPLAVLTLLWFHVSFSQRTVQMNIERIVSDAAVIVHGTVSAVESKLDPQTNILSTFVTFNVIENLYGNPGQTFIVKMAGGHSKTRSIKFPEMPVFNVGEETIVMFYAPSKLGFTSPVGMGQGKFTVLSDPAGNKMIRNDLNNANLFVGMKHTSSLAKSDRSSGKNESVDVKSFTQTLRSLIPILKN